MQCKLPAVEADSMLAISAQHGKGEPTGAVFGTISVAQPQLATPTARASLLTISPFPSSLLRLSHTIPFTCRRTSLGLPSPQQLPSLLWAAELLEKLCLVTLCCD